MGNVRIRHNKFFKVLTIAGSVLGVVSASTFSVFMGLDLAGVNPFITDELRSYSAEFYNEDTLISEATYKRGELVSFPAAPSHEMDGESNYLFIGWDTMGNGLVDMSPLIPYRIYTPVKAKAVYLKTGKFSLSLEDLMNMDLETLLDILDKLNIDWEQFMDLFGLDLEDLMRLLQDKPVLTFNADASKYISYFRTTSYGDFNYGKKQFNSPGFYDSKKISEGSINPLSYTADKLKVASNSGFLPETFDFVNYDITYKTTQDIYPVPDCVYPSSDEGRIDSDAHYSATVQDGYYRAQAAYVPAMDDVIKVLRLPSYSNSAISTDQVAYFRYAVENYTKIPKEYENVVDQMIDENGWVAGDDQHVNSVAAYIEKLGSCSLFKDGQVNLKFEKNKDPVMGLIERKEGSDLDFNTTAVMVFRRLGIPARLVKGYVVPNVQQGENIITILHQHYWCEIYVQRIGWMICDCMNAEDFLGMNPYGELDKQTNPIEDDYTLDRIEVKEPDILDYYLNEELDTTGMTVTAYFTDGSSKEISLNDSDLEIDYSTASIGDETVIVSYTFNGHMETDTFVIHVHDREDDKGKGDADFNFEKTPKVFTQGDDFAYQDIECTITYEDESTYEVPPYDIRVDSSDVDMSQPGTYTVKVSTTVEGETFEDSYEITVGERPVELESIEVSSMPDKTTYHEQEEFDPTGLEIDLVMNNGSKEAAEEGTYTLSGVEVEDMNEIDEHHTVTVTYTREGDGKQFTTSFEIEILENPIEEVEIENTKTEYNVGEYFDLEEFLKDAEATGDLEYADATKGIDLSQADVELAEKVDLSKEGDSTVKLNVTVDGETFEVEIPITVGPADPTKFTLSPDVATSGPGDFEGVDLFKFKSSHIGTIYFRYSCFTDYSGNATWTNEVTASDIYTYNKASQVYENATVDVEYLIDTGYSFVPAYSNDSVSGAKKAGEKDENMSFTTFELNEDSIKRLANFVDYDSTVNTQYSSYRTQVIYANNSPYLQNNSSAEAKALISEFISDNSINKSDDKWANALKVRDVLKTYTYNADFDSYDSSKDPVYSFLKEKEGICSDFGTAATMIFRELGIPARFCTGFAVESYGVEDTCNSIRAHGWSEIWLDGIGWVIVDCTGYDNSNPGKDPALPDAYGTPPAGEGEGDLYTFGLESYGTDISIKYYFNGKEIADDEDNFEITYNGLGYQDLITYELDYDQDAVPFFLELKDEIVEEGKEEPEEPSNANGYNGSFVGVYTYKVKLSIIDKQTKQDVTDKYGFAAIKERTITYTVVPRLLILNVGLSKNKATVGTEYSKVSDFTVSVDDSTPLPAKDGKALETLSFTVDKSVTFTQVGLYYDYGYYLDEFDVVKCRFTFDIYRDITINKATVKTNVSKNYIIIPMFNAVEVA